MIKLKNTTLCYEKGRPVLENVNLHFEKGKFYFITGPSGSGKTTLLKLLHFDLKPTKGSVKVGNFSSNQVTPSALSDIRRVVSIVYQDFKLLYDRSVFENIAFALYINSFTRKVVLKQTMEALNLVDLVHKKDELPHHISGGEQQRTAIARAIVNHPFVLLADEPTGNLDHEASIKVFDIFRQINDLGVTVLMATHDYNLIESVTINYEDPSNSRYNVYRIQNKKVMRL